MRRLPGRSACLQERSTLVNLPGPQDPSCSGHAARGGDPWRAGRRAGTATVPVRRTPGLDLSAQVGPDLRPFRAAGTSPCGVTTQLAVFRSGEAGTTVPDP